MASSWPLTQVPSTIYPTVELDWSLWTPVYASVVSVSVVSASLWACVTLYAAAGAAPLHT